jgi:isocitrate dehydrogenase (NAD+)
MYGTQIQERLELYKLLGCYAQVVFSKSIKSDTFSSLHQNVDIAVFREITEGEYSGIEHEVYPGVIESIKVTTHEASLRLAKYAFEFAFLSRRKKVTAVHKANIMKICDGLFLEACREVAK